MKHIKHLHIQGFQSHTDTTLELHPGMNILIGPSDSGKTAVQRAIRWVSHNEPRGDGYVNAKVKKATATMTMSTGDVITRFRGSDHGYDVNDQRLEGFGTKVPDEVILATGMHKASFGDDSVWLNYAAQLDAPFMLSETSGQSARMLGKIAGTEDLDLAGKLTNSDLIKVRSQRSGYHEQKIKTAAHLLEYQTLDAADDLLKQMVALQAHCDLTTQRMALIQKTAARLQQIRSTMAVLEEALSQIHIPDLTEVKGAHAQIIALNRFDALLRDASARSENIEKRIVALAEKTASPISCHDVTQRAQRMDTLQRIELSLNANTNRAGAYTRTLARLGEAPDLSGVKTTAARLTQVSAIGVRISHNESATEDLAGSVEHYGKIAKGGAEELESFLTGLGICPVCQASMDKERIHNHVKTLVGGNANA